MQSQISAQINPWRVVLIFFQHFPCTVVFWKVPDIAYAICTLSQLRLVSSAAVIRVVTQKGCVTTLITAAEETKLRLLVVFTSRK